MGVDVISAKDVGIYHTKVITAGDSGGLIGWLNENGFRFEESDKPVLDHYIQSGWCFVVAVVRPDANTDLKTGLDGLVDPVILRFGTPSPTYPLALTSTIGTETQVLIYLVSTRKMIAEDRMPLQYAGRFAASDLASITTEPEEHFRGWETNLTYLCKFKAALTAWQMRRDLTFTPAPDDEPYPEHRIRW